MSELDFKKLYTKEYSEYIKSFFQDIRDIMKNYPERLESQIKYYENLIINNGDSIVEETINTHNINTSDIFGEGYTEKYKLDNLILKSRSIQKTIKEDIFDTFIKEIRPL